MDKLTDIKSKLLDELSKETLDFNMILQLSNNLAKLDESQVRFSIDAGVINRLGKELVGKRETAVSELVKNAYDADSTEVKLTFIDAIEKKGTLVIEDNGVGMTKDQLVNGFMRLSSTDKIHRPISDIYKRIKAGKKGIGRFATQRLGEKLTIETQTTDSDIALKVMINWDEFEDDKDLIYVSNAISSIPKTRVQGTTLHIENLRDAWSDAYVKRVYRFTSELLQPFPLSKPKSEIVNDPGFKTYYYRKTDDNLELIVNDEIEILDQALAEIEGYIEEDGQGYWALSSKKLNYKQEVFLIGADNSKNDDLEIKYDHVRNIHFKAYYFVYDGKLFAPGKITLIKELSQVKGGLRLYKNGIRVLPYGEITDDWLGLDKSMNRSIILSPHANVNFFGFVEVNDFSNVVFEETSSREGVVENEAFTDLTSFIYRSLISAVIKISSLRDRKATASQRNYVKKKEEASEEVDSLIDELLGISSATEPGSEESETASGSEQLKETLVNLKDARAREKESISLLINELNMLRVLAGLGLVIGEFIHEIQRYNIGFDAEIEFLKKTKIINEEFLKRVDLLATNIRAYMTYTSYFDATISRNVIRDLKRIELRTVVRDFSKTVENDLIKSKILLSTDFKGYDLFTVPMHPSEWASILFNLYTNSKKAIIRKRVQGHINIECGKADGFVYLEFSDNGDGIAEENREKVFDAFFTTTAAAHYTSNDVSTLTGTGLGLKIVSDIIASYDGDIYIRDPEDGYSTSVTIKIPLGDN